MSADPPAERRLLRTWKEIAAHLRVDVRTAQRWQHSTDVPIVRRAIGGRGHPAAYVDDLDHWLARQHQPQPGSAPAEAGNDHAWPVARRVRLYAVVGAMVASIVVAAVTAWWWRPRPEVFRIEVTDRVVHAFDAAGTALWQAPLPGSGENHLPSGTIEGDRSLLTDLTGDGRTDVVVRVVATPAGGDIGHVVAFSHRGHLLWDRPLDRERTLHGTLVSGRLTPVILRAVSARGRTWVLAVSGHHVHPATQAVLLDAGTGAVTDQYWHPGLITSALVVDLDKDREPEILLGGVVNPRGGFGHAAIVALNVPFSRQPPRDGGLAAFTGGLERAYLVMPRSDVCAALGEHPFVRTLTLEGERIAAGASCGVASVLYWFNRDLTFSEAALSDRFAWVHDRLAGQGALTHRLTAAEADCLRQALRSETAIDVDAEGRPAAWAACR